MSNSCSLPWAPEFWVSAMYVHLKIWGDTQKPQDGMAYLLVKVEDTSEVEGYGMALVWISPHQARASMMVEVLEILSTCAPSGPDWPYILTQLYEGTNHVPLPKDKHLGILPQEKAESPCGQISPTRSPPAFICWTTSHLSSGFEWGQPVSHHRPARTSAWQL